MLCKHNSTIGCIDLERRLPPAYTKSSLLIRSERGIFDTANASEVQVESCPFIICARDYVA